MWYSPYTRLYPRLMRKWKYVYQGSRSFESIFKPCCLPSWLWWLIFCLNWTELEGTQILGHMLSLLCLEGASGDQHLDWSTAQSRFSSRNEFHSLIKVQRGTKAPVWGATAASEMDAGFVLPLTSGESIASFRVSSVLALRLPSLS